MFFFSPPSLYLGFFHDLKQRNKNSGLTEYLFTMIKLYSSDHLIKMYNFFAYKIVLLIFILDLKTYAEIITRMAHFNLETAINEVTHMNSPIQRGPLMRWQRKAMEAGVRSLSLDGLYRSPIIISNIPRHYFSKKIPI